MLNLEELVFKVKTDELVDAVAKVKQLGAEVANLAKPIDKAVASSGKLAKAQQQEADAATKAAKANEDLAVAETKAGKARGEAAPKIDTVTRSIEKQLTAMKVFRGEAINAADGAIALGSAFTKTQANQLAALKVSGATTEALKTMARSFEEFNKITSANTFDNSVAGIQRLRKEISEMSKVNDLMTQGIKLTRDEIVNLVRDSERLTQQFKSEGMSAQQLDIAMKGLEQEHVMLARQKNDLIAKSRESERQAKAEANAQIKAAQDQARAAKYLEDVERRMIAAVDEANRGLDKGATDTLVKYKQALMQAGLAADVAEGKMATLKSQMDLVASRKRADELRYLSRALSVQMGDVAISLASGMNPLLVMIQQGDQIRGVLDQVGAQGDELRKSMTGAAAQIAAGMKNTAIAIGTFLGGAFMGAGKALNTFVAEATGADKALLALKARVIALDGIMTTAAGPGKWVTTLRLASAAVVTLGGVIATGGIAALGAWSVGLYKVIQEENALAKQLALTGNAMGLSFDSAMRLSKGMSDIGVNTGTAMTVLGEMAKTGNFASSELRLVAKSASDMQTYFGVAIEDTVKSFAKMKKEPVEAMFELAKTTGMVSSETIKSVVELKEQGKTAEATALAIKTLASVNSQQVEQMKKDYNGFSLFMIELGKGIKDFFNEAFKAVFYKADPMKQLEDRINQIRKNIEGADPNSPFLKGQQELLRTLNAQLGSMVRVNAEREKAAADQAKTQANYQEFLKDNTSLLNKQQKMQKELKEAEQKFLPLVKEGLVTQEQYNQYLANIRDKYKETNKEVNELERYMNRVQESVRDIAVENSTIGKQEQEITRAVKLRADLMDDPLWSKLTEQGKLNLQAALDILDADERRLKWNEAIRKIQLESLDGYFQYKEKVAEAHSDTLKSLMDEKRTLTESADVLAFQWSLMGKTEEEAKLLTREYERQSKLKKAEYEYWKSISELNDNQALSDEQRRAQKFLLDKNYAEQQRQINSETAKLYADDTLKEFNRIRDGISDAIVTALFEGGKSGKKKLRDLIVAELKKPITMVVNVAVNAMLNSLMGSIGGSGSGGGNSGAGGLNALSSLFGAGGFSGAMTAGTGWLTGAASLSQIWGAGTSLLGTGSLAGILSGGSMLLSSVMPIISVLSLLSGLDDSGTLHTGGIGSYSSALGSQSAQSSSALSGYSGTAFNLDAFSKETAQTGADIAKVVVGILDTSAKTFGQEAGYYAAVGFADDTSKDGAWGQLVVKLGDKMLTDWGSVAGDKWPGRTFADGEAGRKEFEQAVATDLRDILVTQMPAWADEMLMKLGDTVSMDQLGAVMTEINKVQETFNQFGAILPNFANLADEAKKSLIDMAGGIDNLSAAVATYYDKFYSEEEKAANATANLVKEFQKLGISMPSSIKEFRKLVEAQDLNTESGRKMYATLIGISGSFYEVNKEAETVADTLDNSLDSAFSALESAVKREQDMISKRISAIESTRNALSKLFDLLSNATRELYGSVSSTKSGMVSSARQFITNAVATAQSGGGLPDADKLGEAIGTVRTGISDTLYSTRFEQERDTLMLAGELSVLQGFADEQLSSADLQLKELKDQSEQMDLMLESYKVQIDLAKNLDVSVLSVADAIRQMEQTLADILDPTGAKRGKPQATVSGVMGSGGSAYGSGPTTDSYSMTASAADIFGGHLMNSVTNRTAYEQAQVYLNATSATGLGSADAAAAAMAAAGATPDQIAQVQNAAAQYQQYVASTGGSPSSASAFLDAIGANNPYAWMNLPSYDVGTNYVPRDMVAQLHEGEAVVPKRYNPAANGDSEDSAAATDLAGLRVELQAIALNTDKTRRLLERVTMDGNSLLVTDTATL